MANGNKYFKEEGVTSCVKYDGKWDNRRLPPSLGADKVEVRINLDKVTIC